MERKHSFCEYIALKILYFQMLRIRTIEEKLAENYLSEQQKRIELGNGKPIDFNPDEDEMRCPVHFSIGQEAVAVGICMNLEEDDVIFSHHRSIGHYLAKGGDLFSLVAELYGKETGMTHGKGGQTRIVDTKRGICGSSNIVAGTIPIAVGAAFAIKLRNQRRVAVVFFGDGACEEGVFYESLNFAALHELPVVFVCENNFYAVKSPMLSRQKNDNIYERGEVFGVPGYRIDGNDVLQVYSAASKYIKITRENNMPVLIEARTFRQKEHVGPKKSSEENLDNWTDKCPIKKLETSLIQDKILTPPEIEFLKEKFGKEIEEAVDFAKKSPFPSAENLLSNVY